MSAVSPAVPTASPRDLTQAIIGLTQMALSATDLTAGVTPTLDYLIQNTAAVGSAFFQVSGAALSYHVRAATGEMPDSPQMQAIAAHGLPADTPLMRALEGCSSVTPPLRPRRPAFLTWASPAWPPPRCPTRGAACSGRS